MTLSIDEFTKFLEEYKVVGLALGVIIGTAAKDLVNVIVSGVIMPLIGLLLPGEAWKDFAISINSAEIQIGEVLSGSINFLIIAFLVFLFAKLILKEDKVGKK